MNVRRVLRKTLITALAFLAIVLTALRLLLPQLDDQRQLLGQQISAALGHPVEFSGLAVRLQGVNPEITLTEVTIRSVQGNRSILEVDQLQLRLSIFRSLMRRQPVLELLAITGVEFGVVRDSDRIKLVGFSLAGQSQPNDSDEVAEWLLAQQRLQVFDARVHYEDVSRQQKLEIEISSVQFRSVLGGVELSGRLKLAGEARGNLEIAGLVKATTIEELQTAPWQLYLDIKGLQLANAVDRKFQIGGDLALRGWLFGDGLSLAHTDGGLEWNQPSIRRGDDSQSWQGDLFQSEFSWNRLENGWRGRLHGLKFSSATDNWFGEEMSVNRQGKAVFIDGGKIDLGVAAELADVVLDETNEKVQWMRRLAPTGTVNQFRVDLAEVGPMDWTLAGLAVDFDKLVVNSDQNLPGVSGFGGSLTVVGTEGRLLIDSSNSIINAETVFPGPLSFNRVSAQIDWQKLGTDLTVSWQNLVVRNSDLSLSGHGQVTIHPGESPLLRMVLGVEQFDIAQLEHYLPVSVIPAGVVRWLTGALVSGQLVDTGLLWNGKVAEYPYHPDSGSQGRFLVSGEVKGAELNYVPGSTFPEISELDASIVVTGRKMRIDGHRGLIYDSELSEVTAVIDDLANRQNHVRVIGNVDGALQNGLRYLTESPLKNNIGRYVSDLTSTGPAHLELDLDIPFKKGRKIKVDGVLALPGNRLKFAQPRLLLSDTAGVLMFDQSGIHGSGIKANLFGGPATLVIETSEGEPGISDPSILGSTTPGLDPADQPVRSKGLSIKGTGVLDIEKVAEYISWSEFELASGEAPWNADLALFGGGLELRVGADLTQVTVNLPSPLAKPVDQAGWLALELSCQCSKSDAPLELSLTLDNAWYVDWLLARGSDSLGASRGVISAARRGLIPANGALLTGSLPRIDFGPWQHWVSSLPAGGNGGSVITVLDVELVQLDIFGQRFPDIRINGELVDDHWRLAVESAEALGNVDYQLKSAQLDLDFKKLSLFSEGGVEGVSTETGFGDFPSLKVEVGNLLFDGAPMGRLRMTVEPAMATALSFNNIRLNSKHSQITAKGRWLLADESGGELERSFFQGELNTDNFGDVLALIGQPQAVSGGQGSMQWQLDWPGGPQAFSLAHLTGELSLKMKNGSLMGLEPGLGRLFGLLSVNSLQRRMSLDFSDLVGTGFVFDKLQSRLASVDGQLAISSLELDGPAADIKVTGDIALEDLRLSLSVDAVPKVTESLPLAVTIGSPGLGAALFIGQRLLGNRIDDVTTRKYRITGTADQPVVELVDENVFKKLLGGRSFSDLGG